MKFIALALAASFSVASPAAMAGDTHEKALQGDYQAQRNFAYGFATGEKGQKKDWESACTWYLLIVRSDSQKLNTGDIGNIVTYCDKLDFDKRLSAERKANALYRQIYQK